LLSDILGSENDSIITSIEKIEEKKVLLRAVEELNSREKIIVDLRFGLSGGKELTQKEVADLLGISQSYISRIEKKIMTTLKKKIDEKI
jgi:RNA polymerase sporulation-specific sigma factor